MDYLRSYFIQILLKFKVQITRLFRSVTAGDEGCALRGDFPGHDIVTMPLADSWRECKELCKAESACLAVTYVNHQVGSNYIYGNVSIATFWSICLLIILYVSVPICFVFLSIYILKALMLPHRGALIKWTNAWAVRECQEYCLSQQNPKRTDAAKGTCFLKSKENGTGFEPRDDMWLSSANMNCYAKKGWWTKSQYLGTANLRLHG